MNTKRIYHAADSLGRKRCAKWVPLHGKKGEEAQCMRAAVEGEYCKQHAAIARREPQES